MESSDHFMRRMATKMYEKFAKYWSEFNTFMVVAVVLDPRFKLQFLEWSFKKIYGEGSEFEEEMEKFRERFFRLYKVYESAFAAKEKSSGKCGHGQMANNSMVAGDEFMTDFDCFSTTQATATSKGDLEFYYEDPLFPYTSNVDVLSYWRNNASRYPILFQMARDVLAVPISTVASESAFSTGCRVLDCFRSSWKPSTVEEIVCLRDWIYGEET